MSHTIKFILTQNDVIHCVRGFYIMVLFWWLLGVSQFKLVVKLRSCTQLIRIPRFAKKKTLIVKS